MSKSRHVACMKFGHSHFSQQQATSGGVRVLQPMTAPTQGLTALRFIGVSITDEEREDLCIFVERELSIGRGWNAAAR